MKNFFYRGVHGNTIPHVVSLCKGSYQSHLLKMTFFLGVLLVGNYNFTASAQQRNCGDAIDYFNTAAYNNNDGDLLWTSDWIEGNDDGSATTGDIYTTGNGFLILTGDEGIFGGVTCRTIERAIDISNYSEAVLTAKYSTNGTIDANDVVTLSVSIDGGNNFITLDQFDQTTAGEQFVYYDMTPYITANTIVRWEVCGFGDGTESADVEFFNVTGCNEEIITGPCSDGIFRWENASGTSGYTWTRDDAANNYVIPYNGGADNVNLTVTVIDPNNRNSDSDSHSAATHPFDPAGGCEMYPGSDPTEDVIPGDGSIIDPWDSDCGQLWTETNGAYGPNYLTWVMYAENHEEMVTLEFCFDQPVLMTDFNVSDIDYQGLLFSNQIEPYEAPGNSYQDEIIVSAVDEFGNDVPITITPLGSQVIVDGQTARANYDPTSTVSNDLSPNDVNGEVVLDADGVISCFYLSYSNGPDDAADEQANPDLYPWWSNTNGATNGVSDDQAIRIDGFNICVCPEFIISIANDTICEGDLGTVLIESVQGGIPPYSYLWDDGSTSAMYSDSPTTEQQVEVVLITDVQGCNDTANAVIYVEDCCPIQTCLPVTITKNE